MATAGFNTSIEHALWLLDFSKKAEAAGLIKNVPSDFLPPWMANPNYLPPDKSGEFNVIIAVTFGLAFLTVICRLYSRSFIMKNFGIDDWLIIAAMLATILFAATNFCLMAYGGVGKHVWDATPQQIAITFKLIYFHIAGYIVGIFLVKLSILFMYRRIIPEKNYLQRVLDAFFVFHIAYFVIAELVFGLQCDPPLASIDLGVRLNSQPRCLDLGSLFYAFGITHVILDILLLGLPLKVVWHLKVPNKKKATIIVMFLVGGVACFCPIMRMVSLHAVLNGYDLTWAIFEPGMWGQLEICIGIICASIPPAKIFFSKAYRILTCTHNNLVETRTPSHSRSMTPGAEKKHKFKGAFGIGSSERSRSTRNDPELGGSELIDMKAPPSAYIPERKNTVASLAQLASPTTVVRPTFLRSVSDTSSDLSAMSPIDEISDARRVSAVSVTNPDNFKVPAYLSPKDYQ